MIWKQFIPLSSASCDFRREITIFPRPPSEKNYYVNLREASKDPHRWIGVINPKRKNALVYWIDASNLAPGLFVMGIHPNRYVTAIRETLQHGKRST
ncbi:hypothetical protein SAMN05216459_1079 [Ensifer sp. OV372]|nr:hypothetical protein SAMN05216459_1079 [Ensifer sp. OV372]